MMPDSCTLSGYDPIMLRTLVLSVCLWAFAQWALAHDSVQDSSIFLVTLELPHLDANAGFSRADIASLQMLQDETIETLARALGRDLVPLHRYFASHNGVSVRISASEARLLAFQPGVGAVRRERQFELATWNSPGFIGADLVWDDPSLPSGNGLRGQGLVAAVLDTGLPEGAHPSFVNDVNCSHGVDHPDKVLAKVDCSSTDGLGFCNGADPFDRHGHGSHVAGILAGNQVDRSAIPAPPMPAGKDFISGVAPCASLRSYKVCPDALCPESHILAGLNQVLLDGDAAVVNFSISGGRDPWRDNDRAKLDLVAADIVVVAAAGNTGPGVGNPVGAVNHLGPWVLSVAASSRNVTSAGVPAQGDVLAPFSLRGPTPDPLANLQKPDLTGPGIDIRSAWPDGYALRSGTSMSSPHVAGAALLLRQAYPDWSAMEVKSALRLSAFAQGYAADGETPWHPDEVGSGRVDLPQAVRVGLVLDESMDAFLSARPVLGGDVRKLNLPALRDRDCSPACSWQRELRNTLTEPSDWQVTIVAPGDVAIDVSPGKFSFGGGLEEKQTLSIQARPLADLEGELRFAEIRLTELSGRSSPLRFTVALSGQPGAALLVDPEQLNVHAGEGAVVHADLTLANPGAYALEWQARATVRGSTGAADKISFSVPPFSLAGGGPAHIHGKLMDAVQPGRVTGLQFRGTVDLEPESWASDLRLVVTSPQGDEFPVGGFDSLDRPWDFQGVGSSLSDTYASFHDDPLGSKAVELTGEWTLGFSNDFADGGRMDWHDLEVTLIINHDDCKQVAEPDWLSISPMAGQLEPGEVGELALAFDATALIPGRHETALCLTSNALDAAELVVPVRLDLFPAPGPDQALVSGQVNTLGECDAASTPLAGAAVGLGDGAGMVQTAPGGHFQLPVEAGVAGQLLTVSAPGHQGAEVALPPLGGGDEYALTVDLRVNDACPQLQVDTAFLSLEAGEQAPLELTLANAGASGFDWQLVAGRGAACQNDPPDWLDGLPALGSLEADESGALALMVRTEGLASGNYPIRLCLFPAGASVPVAVQDFQLEVMANPHSWTMSGEVTAAGYCGQASAPPADARLILASSEGPVRELDLPQNGQFQLGADVRFQPYDLTVSAEGHGSKTLTDLEAQAGDSLALELKLEKDLPCAAAALLEPAPVIEVGQMTQLTLGLDNQDGAAALDWELKFARALPARKEDGSRPHDPTLDETLSLGQVLLTPPGSDSSSFLVSQDAGVTSSGRVIGLSFSGDVSGISEQPGRASDLQLEFQAPDQSPGTLGGFSSLVNAWSFQGPSSDQDGSYASSHWLDALSQPLFGDEGVLDAGGWQFRLAHDWHSSQAGSMHWQDLSITLHKMAVAGCQHPEPIAWLSLADNDQAGMLLPGDQRDVTLTVDAADLDPGAYRALVCLSSSDPNQPMLGVEIDMIVEPPVTRVFTDRFETVK